MMKVVKWIVRLIGLGLVALAEYGYTVLVWHAPPFRAMISATLLCMVLVFGCILLGVSFAMPTAEKVGRRQAQPQGNPLRLHCEIRSAGCQDIADRYCTERDKLICAACFTQHTCTMTYHQEPSTMFLMRAALQIKGGK